MSNIQIFNNPEFGSIRSVRKNGEPWFVGKDVAEILGYESPRSAVSKKVDTEDRGVSKMATPSGIQEMTLINESGLYSLILSSKLPTAKKFKHWVTSEVLPAIRKTGGYIPVNQGMSDMEVLARAVLISKKTIDVLKEKNKLLETENEAMKPKALFADAYAATKDGILVGAMAKMLRQNGIEIGQNRLFRILRERGYLMKGGADKNMPTQRSMESGWFRIKARTITTPDGSNRSTRTVLVTGKGQQYFVDLFLKEEPGLW
jgi:anti-repressor protein